MSNLITFVGEGFIIYSGPRGDIILKDDRVYVEEPSENTREIPLRDLEFAMLYIRIQGPTAR